MYFSSLLLPQRVKRIENIEILYHVHGQKYNHLHIQNIEIFHSFTEK